MNKIGSILNSKGILMKHSRYFFLLCIPITLLCGQKTFIHAGKMVDGKNDIPIETIPAQTGEDRPSQSLGDTGPPDQTRVRQVKLPSANR